MLTIALLVYTAVMLALHLFGRWLLPGMLVRPRLFWSARWLFRIEAVYYLLLGIFSIRHTTAFPLWPAAVLGIIHLAGWLVGEYHPALSTAMPWTPRLERLLNEISLFDLGEAVFLGFIMRSLLSGASPV